MKVRIVHITKDDKFLDSLIIALDSDNRIENIYYVVNKSQKTIENVKLKERVQSITFRKLRGILKSGTYDVVYFHSINESAWAVINWIPNDKKIIWWSWGYDLYVKRMPGFKPLIDIPLYKPESQRYIDEYGSGFEISNIVLRLLAFVKSKYFQHCRKKNLKRIDYFFPVIPLEYDYLKDKEGFHAQLFSNPRNNLKWEFTYHNCREDNAPVVFIGNSATPTNNHLDVWQKIETSGVTGKKLVFPLSYGSTSYKKFIIEKIKSDKNDILLLQDFVPFEQYDQMIKNCQYAFLGVLRQQADGNVSLFIRHGIKMFFYEDSMMYKHLKAMGCFVYSIDKLTKKDLETPLTKEQAEHNYKAWFDFRLSEGETYRIIMEKIISMCGK